MYLFSGKSVMSSTPSPPALHSQRRTGDEGIQGDDSQFQIVSDEKEGKLSCLIGKAAKSVDFCGSESPQVNK